MGLYLAVFETEQGDIEQGGIDVGGYDDFEAFRATVAASLEGGDRGSRFPTLMLHHDSDGIWAEDEVVGLAAEVATIGLELRRLPPLDRGDQTWPAQSGATTLFDSFRDVEGDPLVQSLDDLLRVATEAHQPVWFQ